MPTASATGYRSRLIMGYLKLFSKSGGIKITTLRLMKEENGTNLFT